MPLSGLRMQFLLCQMLVSGGVDSTVCAALMHRALQPEQVIALHVDNGFMRQNESQRVEESLRALGLHLNGQYKDKYVG